MKTALITGANKGIGFEVAKQLLQKGFYVYIGSRDKKKGQEAVEKLRADGLVNTEATNRKILQRRNESCNR
jgi:NAD(P)-dependent dehydrogenase (short-subunit alcohol dehydrogenase family)